MQEMTAPLALRGNRAARRLWTGLVLAGVACAPIPGKAPFAEAPDPAPTPAHEGSCAVAFDSLQTIFRRDYPGYHEKVRGRESELAALTDSVAAIVRTSDHHSICVAQGLQPWLAFFADPHVMVWQAGPPSPPPPDAPVSSGYSGEPGPDDPDRPSIEFLEDSTALLRLPSFGVEYKPAIDSLIAANRPKLLSTPYLIVDVRENAGGFTGSYASVTPLLYTGPIHQHGVDIWASPGNVELMREWLVDPAAPAAAKAQARAVLPRMEAAPNQFVPLVEAGEIRLDTVYPMPRRVAVLVGRGCASSCENFVLQVLQSEKVTVLGKENTRGMFDYGNVRAVWLPGWRRLRMPTTRNRRLLEAGPLDNAGIPPEVRIRDEDPIFFARQYLLSGGR